MRSQNPGVLGTKWLGGCLMILGGLAGFAAVRAELSEQRTNLSGNTLMLAQEDDPLAWTKPKRGPKPKPPRPTDPLQWSVQIPANADTDAVKRIQVQSQEFFAGERFQIRVKTARNGYLYVIHRNLDKSGKVINTPRLIYNYIVRNQEILLPLDCEFRDKYGRCWWETESIDGQKAVTLILSREPLSGLSVQVPRDGFRLDRNLLGEIVGRLKPELESKVPESRRANLLETITLTYNKGRRALN